MKRLSLLAAALLFAACGAKRCREHTAFVTIDFDTTTSKATSLQLTVSVGGNPPAKPAAVTLSGDETSTTVEVDFGAYQPNASFTVLAMASADGAVLGSGTQTGTLGARCGEITVSVVGNGPHDDASVSDMREPVDLGDDGSSPRDMASCGVLYVAPPGNGGNDTNSGCAQSAPLATIGHALSIAGTKPIHVCAGNYTAAGELVSGVLMGGYDCSSWTRDPHFGYPSFAGPQSIIETSVKHVPTVTVPMTAATGTIIDGFTINGPTGYTTTSVALSVLGTAVISNNSIVGGSATVATGYGSVGIDVESDAQITKNTITGGSGATGNGNAGSVGLLSGDTNAAAAPHVIGNTVDGGSGSFESGMYFGAVGMIFNGTGSLTLASANAIEKNVITGGEPIAVGSGYSAVGVILGGSATMELVDNQITATPADNPQGGNVVGVLLSGSGAMHVFQNRIYGGSGNNTYGVISNTVIDNGRADIESNMILGGQAIGSGSSYVVDVEDHDAKILHNTLIASNDGASGEHSIIYLVSDSAYAADIEDNLLAGAGANTTVAINAENACVTGAAAVLKNNVTLNTTYVLSTDASGCGTGPAGTYVDDSFETTQYAGAANNMYLLSTCPTDTNCATISCATPEGCLTAMFASWDSTTNGYATLTAPTTPGWILGENAPCAVSKGPAAVATLTFPSDLYGTTWPAIDPSIGADQAATVQPGCPTR